MFSPIKYGKIQNIYYFIIIKCAVVEFCEMAIHAYISERSNRQ